MRFLVLHYTGMVTAQAALDLLCDPASSVSAHYLIDEGGQVFRLVAEDRRAWHAGVSSWQGERDVNAASVGIELVNPGHEWGYRPFPDVQMRSLVTLATGILARHPIAPDGVVGHSDVAPRRKIDPGELFDWRRLAAAGIGRWPADLVDPAPGAPPFAPEEGLRRLACLGYGLDDPPATVTAFQRRFRPARIDGALDAETLWRIARLVRGN